MFDISAQEFTDPYLNRPIPFEIRVERPQPSEFEWMKIAFWNVMTPYVWEKPSFPKQKYPHYEWDKRKGPMVDLICKDRPTVLALCEMDLLLVAELEREMNGGGLDGYRLIGFSSELNQSIEEVKKKYCPKAWKKYGEFIGLLFDAKRIEVLDVQSIRLPVYPDQKWRRILVKATLCDRIAKKTFVILASHFDNKSAKSRRASADVELKIIGELEQQSIPWISVADRNWGRNRDGENQAKRYASLQGVVDFRDQTHLGCFGMPGTFQNRDLKFDWIAGVRVIRANVVDTGYRSKNGMDALFYYTLTGAYDPATGKLVEAVGQERVCVSDHFYLGQVCKLR